MSFIWDSILITSAADETIQRAHAYLKAGADCVFIFGTNDKELLSRMVKAIAAPVNLLTGLGMPSVPELQQMGVRRFSLGSGAMRAALGSLMGISKELLKEGTYQSLTQNAVPYGELQKLFS